MIDKKTKAPVLDLINMLNNSFLLGRCGCVRCSLGKSKGHDIKVFNASVNRQFAISDKLTLMRLTDAAYSSHFGKEIDFSAIVFEEITELLGSLFSVIWYELCCMSGLNQEIEIL